MNNELVMQEQETKNALAMSNEAPMGFDDDDADDLIIPRVKMVQAMSPERKEKVADEGDIINSLTKDKLNGKVFIPVFKFNNNILWNPREAGGGMKCVARDGKMGTELDTQVTKLCRACGKCEFDNTKKGKEAAPTCTKYINFFGFFEGEQAPIILSFARTNFAEGKKLYSLAKVTMQNMFNNGYKLVEKECNKNGNSWFIIDVKPNGPTSAEDREFATALFHAYKPMITTMNMDMDNAVGGTNDVVDDVIIDTDENLEY